MNELLVPSIIIAVIAVVEAITAIIDYRTNRTATNLLRTSKCIADANTALANKYQSIAEREQEINVLLSDILIDLAHTKDNNAICWKLFNLRQAEIVMKSTGYYNDNIRDWLVKLLTSEPPETQLDYVTLIRNSVRGYYVMDPEKGKNLIALLEDMIKFDDCHKTDVEYRSYLMTLKDQVEKTGFDLPMYVEEPKVEEPHPVATFDELLAAFKDFEARECAEFYTSNQNEGGMENEISEDQPTECGAGPVEEADGVHRDPPGYPVQGTPPQEEGVPEEDRSADSKVMII